RWNDPTPTGTQGTFATTSKQSHSLNVMVMMLVTPLASMSTVTQACCRTTESSYLLGMTNIGLERCAIELRQPEITASAWSFLVEMMSFGRFATGAAPKTLSAQF